MDPLAIAMALLQKVVKANASRQAVAATTCALLRTLTDGQLASQESDLQYRTEVVVGALQAQERQLQSLVKGSS